MQHEITRPIALLDETGNLTEPGYAKKNLISYERSAIKAGSLRIKEWDYYMVCNDRFAVALTIADNSYMGLDSFSFIQFDSHVEKTVSRMQVLTKGKKHLPASSENGDITASGSHYHVSFRHEGASRILEFLIESFDGGQPFSGKIKLSDAPEESMVIATPFDKPGHFYFNQKINCLRAEGTVRYQGQDYVFDKENSFGVLDWGRGVWTYKNTWYWGSASGLAEGVPFGFNIGYGFGNTSAATENMLFYNGKAHKLGAVAFNIPHDRTGREDYMSPWTFTSDDGRFEMDFIPILDRASCTSLFAIKSDQHQVFGRFSGNAVLDDGTVIRIKDFTGFAEKVFNKW